MKTIGTYKDEHDPELEKIARKLNDLRPQHILLEKLGTHKVTIPDDAPEDLNSENWRKIDIANVRLNRRSIQFPLEFFCDPNPPLTCQYSFLYLQRIGKGEAGTHYAVFVRPIRENFAKIGF